MTDRGSSGPVTYGRGPGRFPEAADLLSAFVAAVYFQAKGRPAEAQAALRPIASHPWGGIPPLVEADNRSAARIPPREVPQ